MDLERLLAKLRALGQQGLRVRALAEAMGDGEATTWVATIHALLAFVFNVGVVALSVNLLASPR